VCVTKKFRLADVKRERGPFFDAGFAKPAEPSRAPRRNPGALPPHRSGSAPSTKKRGGRALSLSGLFDDHRDLLIRVGEG
jgi:hypothetical protein